MSLFHCSCTVGRRVLICLFTKRDIYVEYSFAIGITKDDFCVCVCVCVCQCVSVNEQLRKKKEEKIKLRERLRKSRNGIDKDDHFIAKI